MCLKWNIDEIIHNLGLLLYAENLNFDQYLSSKTFPSFFVLFFFGGGEISLRKCVVSDIHFHIMIQFKRNFAIKFLGNLALQTLYRSFK